MRIWLAGSRTFGAVVYKEIKRIKDVEIVAVTAPLDNKDALFKIASYEMQVYENIVPKVVSDKVVDLIVSAQNYTYISMEAINKTMWGAIGYHPSLLPRHRGRSSVEWTVAMNDPITGGTIYQMDDGWDTGPIIAQGFCHVAQDWSASDLWREALFDIGVKLLVDTISLGPENWSQIPQDERFATTEPIYVAAKKIKQIC